MNWWVPANADVHVSYKRFYYADPGDVLGLWRTAKLQRGLVRHPSRDVRTCACADLIGLSGWGQDECWTDLSAEDRDYLVNRITAALLRTSKMGGGTYRRCPRLGSGKE
jgi:hypothetical protein